MKNLVAVSFFAVLLISCSYEKTIANPEDYHVYLNEEGIHAQQDQGKMDLLFWQERLQEDTGSYVNKVQAAIAQFRLFKLSGAITALRSGDSLLRSASIKLNDTDPELLFALSQAAITQHQFRDAAGFSYAASEAAGDPYITRLLDFDANMELGNYGEATKRLDDLKDKSSFDYLIRKAKYEDHKGNLDEAIRIMETAFEKVKDKNNALYCWALANLGDMYGHAGQVTKSYNAYLKVLGKDPHHTHALKGIAWIAFAHDHNTGEAKRILRFILSVTKMPDLYLVLADIASWEGDKQAYEANVQHFINEVSQPAYGDMYNKYLIEVFADRPADVKKAIVLAKKEVANRPTAETMDWLAWAFYKAGEVDKAATIITGHVYKINFEPSALYHCAMIFAATGKTTEARQLLEECLESSFELGPLQTNEINEVLATL